jgi:hypothetical protein
MNSKMSTYLSDKMLPKNFFCEKTGGVTNLFSRKGWQEGDNSSVYEYVDLCILMYIQYRGVIREEFVDQGSRFNPGFLG